MNWTDSGKRLRSFRQNNSEAAILSPLSGSEAVVKRLQERGNCGVCATGIYDMTCRGEFAAFQAAVN
jgi:hypothetical protein